MRPWRGLVHADVMQEETTQFVGTYGVTGELLRLWSKAEALYRIGNRSPDSYFDGEETRLLKQRGLGEMDIYDYVEDFVKGGEPDFGTFVAVTLERVFFFSDEMGGVPSEHSIREEDLPPKTEAVDGIEWLPRILVKARGKLRGELPPQIMYGCGGDRGFLRSRGIHPAEFLRKVRTAESDRVVIDWVAARPVAQA